MGFAYSKSDKILNDIDLKELLEESAFMKKHSYQKCVPVFSAKINCPKIKVMPKKSL